MRPSPRLTTIFLLCSGLLLSCRLIAPYGSPPDGAPLADSKGVPDGHKPKPDHGGGDPVDLGSDSLLDSSADLDQFVTDLPAPDLVPSDLVAVDITNPDLVPVSDLPQADLIADGLSDQSTDHFFDLLIAPLDILTPATDSHFPKSDALGQPPDTIPLPIDADVFPISDLATDALGDATSDGSNDSTVNPSKDGLIIGLDGALVLEIGLTDFGLVGLDAAPTSCSPTSVTPVMTCGPHITGGKVDWCPIPSGTYCAGPRDGDPCDPSQPSPKATALTHDFELNQNEIRLQDLTALNQALQPVINGSAWTGPATLTSSEAQSLRLRLDEILADSATGCAAGECPVRALSWHEAAYICTVLIALTDSSVDKSIAPCYDCSIASSAGAPANIACHFNVSAYGSGPDAIYACGGYRLPTEAEWEHAYRAGSAVDLYVTGSQSGLLQAVCGDRDSSADAIAWYFGTDPQPVCSLQDPSKPNKNAFGLCDMAGNVFEWVDDVYTLNYPTPTTDPWAGPTTIGVSNDRVVRGGAFDSRVEELRGAYRAGHGDTTVHPRFGFRCARTLAP